MRTPAPLERVSVTTAAGRLGVSPRMVQTMIRSGELPAIRVGRVYRVALADLDAYIDAAQVTPR